jgi:hypothetical protein
MYKKVLIKASKDHFRYIEQEGIECSELPICTLLEELGEEGQENCY